MAGKKTGMSETFSFFAHFSTYDKNTIPPQKSQPHLYTLFVLPSAYTFAALNNRSLFLDFSGTKQLLFQY